MTTTPAPGADKATEELRTLLTAAINASFDCGAHDCDIDAGDPAPYAELARIAAEKREAIVEFFRATLAAVPASEPVAVVTGSTVQWLPGAGALKDRTELYAAPAPVSGMSDLARLARWTFDGGMAASVAVDGQWYAAADVERLLNPTGATK